MRPLFVVIGILIAAKFVSRPHAQEPVKLHNPSPFVPVMRALIDVESSGNAKAMRYEPHLQSKYKWPKNWAYSYGLTQVVFGFHKDRCGLSHPEDLFDAKINIECGHKVLRDCYTRHGSLTEALGCYNGDRSGKYANKVLSRMVAVSAKKTL